jgi:hypothetical protein
MRVSKTDIFNYLDSCGFERETRNTDDEQDAKSMFELEHIGNMEFFDGVIDDYVYGF